MGNTRVVYTPTVGPYYTSYTLSALVDYFPYGKVLRSYYNGEEERYLTTHHERDGETGLDYRGARFYDSDNGRFLSLDPAAMEFASWSGYNYVLGNPIKLVDMDGKRPGPGGGEGKDPGFWENVGKYVLHIESSLMGNAPNNEYDGTKGMRRAGETVEEAGDYVMLVGVSSSGTVVGTILIPVGEGISMFGSGLQIYADLAEGDKESAVTSVIIGTVPGVPSSMLKKGINKYIDKLDAPEQMKNQAKQVIKGQASLMEYTMKKIIQDYRNNDCSANDNYK